MSDAPPTRKSALKKQTLRINRNTTVPTRHLMFNNTARVRPFNFRNTSAAAANTSANIGIQVVEGKNARGNAPGIRPNDPRADPQYAYALGTNKQALRKSMAQNKQNRYLGVNAPTLNMFRFPGMEKIKRAATQSMLAAKHHEMGYPVEELNYIMLQGANENYMNEERRAMKQPYFNHARQNIAAAYRSAQINEKVAQQIAAGAAGGKSRRNRKTRRNRK
jgi:hypothetical protein